MCKIFKNSLPLFLVVLKLLRVEAKHICSNMDNCTTNATVHDLKLVCSISDGKSTLTVIPPQCTVVAEYSNDLDLLHRVYGFKGHLPFLVIVDTVKYDVTNSFEEEMNLFSDIVVDFVAFDLHKILHTHKPPSDATQTLVDWFNILRTDGGANLGFLIQNDVDWLKTKDINFGPINEVVDFYILQSTGYRICRYHQHQNDMPALATKEDVMRSIEGLKGMGIDLSILIFTIDLKVESMKVVDPQDMSYSYLCSNTLSELRKYCFNTIECLFDKARLRMSENVTGIFVQGIDYDDVDGTCHCVTSTDSDPKFRGLKTICGASQESVNNVTFYTCSDGAFPVINEK